VVARTSGQTRTISTLDATSNTVVLAFDLSDPRIADMPNELSRVIHGPFVQSAIRKALVELALARQRLGTSTISDKEACRFAGALAGGVAGAMGADLFDRIRQTPEFVSVEQSLKSLDETLKNSPLGVWIDRNRGVLYVVGAGIAIGGAAALFATKTGGSVLNVPITRLATKPLKVFNLGSFSLAGQIVSFQPRTQTVGVALVAMEQLERLQVGVQLGVVATGGAVEQVNGKLVFKTQDVSLSLIGTGKPLEKTVNLGLGIEVTNHGLPGRLSIEVALGVHGSTSQERRTVEIPRVRPGSTGTYELPGHNDAKLLAKWSMAF
jgi:hypothetical protein